MGRAMDGNTEGRRLRKKRRPFPFGLAYQPNGEDQRLMVSFSMFWVISSKAAANSVPVAAS